MPGAEYKKKAKNQQFTYHSDSIPPFLERSKKFNGDCICRDAIAANLWTAKIAPRKCPQHYENFEMRIFVVVVLIDWPWP